MSPSDNRPMASLELRFDLPAGVNPADLRFSIYDGWENLLPEWDKHMIENPGAATLLLPDGLYTVRWEYAGGMQEKVVRLPQQQHLEVSFLLETPAPVPGAADTHEYYSHTNGTVPWNEMTGEPLGDPSNIDSRLHLLLRARNHEAYNHEDLAEGLRLLDEELKPLFELRDRSRLDTWGGSLLCSLPARSGRYFLEYDGGPDKLPRLFPIHLFEGWQTRLFLFYEFEQPDFASASLSLVRLDYDDSYDPEREKRFRVNAALDMALDSLQNNRSEIPREIERGLLYGKFENPMMGLLGAHFLLQHSDASQSDPDQEARWRTTAKIVLGNLKHLLPDSPDVDALRFKAAMRFGTKHFRFPTRPVGKLPLLRVSLEALLAADSEAVQAVEGGSLIESLSANLYYDSPWATFRPLEPQRAEKPLGAGLESWSTKSPSFDTPRGPERETIDNDDWLANSIREAIQMTARQTGQEPDWSRLATSLGVPYRKMLRAVEQVKVQVGGTGNVQVDQIQARNAQVGGSGNTQVNAEKIESGDIKVGDIIGGTGVAIGRNISQQIHISRGASADEIGQAFAVLQQAMQKMPDGAEKGMAQAALDGLKTEATKGDQVRESDVEKWLAFLLNAAPDIWEVAVDTFANPIKGLGTVYQKVAQRAKAEKGK